jgi:hypothetical protein
VPAVYLDYNATTPVDPAALEAMLPYLKDHWGNPLWTITRTCGSDHLARMAKQTPRRSAGASGGSGVGDQSETPGRAAGGWVGVRCGVIPG